jgi:hypothetical protein
VQGELFEVQSSGRDKQQINFPNIPLSQTWAQHRPQIANPYPRIEKTNGIRHIDVLANL